MSQTKEKQKNKIFRAGICLFLASLLIVPAYLVAVFEGIYYLSFKTAAVLIVVLTLLLLLMRRVKAKVLITAAGVIAAVWTVLIFTAANSYKEMRENMHYISPPDSKAQVFSDKSVMLLIPHQDDEINVLGGVIEEYLKYSSELTVVYSTNGDYYGIGETRLEEAAAALSLLGLDEKNIVFLGYGNEWQGGQIYNSADHEIKSSHAGFTSTYGSEKYPAYREGREYTKANFLQDIREVILEKRPELIYCVDYDYNKDHRALSMAFEKVMGEILRDEPDYTPVVLKAFAYSTAWYAPYDYEDTLNLASTKNLYPSDYMQENNVYLWNERLRLPVSAASLSRVPEMSRLYEALAMHRSQNAVDNARGIINSDKVFWQRETGSVLYNAEISVSSGDGTRLNDFMLTDCRDIESDLMPFEGTWMPDYNDSKKFLSIMLPEPVNIDRIKLYDKPSMEENILNVIIRLDDGTELKSGPLFPNGSATELKVNRQDIRKIEMYIDKAEGAAPGLTEIEAYSQEKVNEFPYIKLTNEEGDFLYDCVSERETIRLGLHSTLGLSMTSPDISVKSDNTQVKPEKNGEYLEINVPEGEKAVITVHHEQSGLEDSIIVRRSESLNGRNHLLAEHIHDRHMALNQRQQEYYGMIIKGSLPGSILQVARAAG